LKDVKLTRTIWELFGRCYRIVFFDEDKMVRIKLLPKQKIGKNMMFTYDREKYIFDENSVYYIDKIPHLFYKKGVPVPFTIEASDVPSPKWNSTLLHNALELDFGVKLLSRDNILNVGTIGMFVALGLLAIVLLRGG